MKRYWIPKEWVGAEYVELEGEVYHHIHRVCRNERGARFEVLAGEQRAYFVELMEARKKEGRARILEVRQIPPLPQPWIHLALSLPRFQKTDFIIEKAVELGVFRFHPFVSMYSFVRQVDSQLLGRKKRWDKIARGATQQSGRGDVMDVAECRTLDQILEEFNQDPAALGLFPYEGDCEQTARDALSCLKSEFQSDRHRHLWLFIGSEGGFSESEVEQFRRFGLKPMSLGEQILRVDTACLAMVSILKYEFGLLGGS